MHPRFSRIEASSECAGVDPDWFAAELRLPWVLPAERFGPVADLDAVHLRVLAR
jgi:hypothetical protein